MQEPHGVITFGDIPLTKLSQWDKNVRSGVTVSKRKRHALSCQAASQADLPQEIEAQEPWPILFSEVVECLNTLAMLYLDQGRFEVAEQYSQLDSHLT